MASLPLAWRNAVRDSDLDSTAKLAGHTLSTYMTGRGLAYPSRETLARGASLALRSVDAASEAAVLRKTPMGMPG